MGQPATQKTGKSSSSAFHYHSYIKDSIAVQRQRSYVNDSEEHETNPHLQDFLVPHHIGDVKSEDQEDEAHASTTISRKPTLSRPCVSILHNVDCPSRHSCEITESNRHISFHRVVVREYDMILGDHPNCSYGPPVSLGWHYLEYEPVDVNEYEYHHSRRRPLRQLCLNFYRRKEILSKDYSEEEVKEAVKEKDRIMLQRAITRKSLPCMKVEELLERAHRKVKKRLKKRKSTSKGSSWRSEDELDWSRSKFTKNSSILKDSTNRE